MKVIVVGPRGKMGKLITQVAAARNDMELVAGIGPKDREYIGKDLGTVAMVGRELGVPVTDDLESVIDGCDVIIDFSTKEMAMDVLSLAISHKKALVCGTTGFTEDEMQRFMDASKVIPMLYAANTSKLVNIMNKLLELVATTLKARLISRFWKCMTSGKRMLPAALPGKWEKSWPTLLARN
ncbi:MAG: 4-hydroxy-tetrahydrodipicolinate reductase [[Clostridium] scindens]